MNRNNVLKDDGSHAAVFAPSQEIHYACHDVASQRHAQARCGPDIIGGQQRSTASHRERYNELPDDQCGSLLTLGGFHR